MEQKVVARTEETPIPMYVEKHSRKGGSTLVRNVRKVGRNELCPCGSGKKFKKCCMVSTEVDTGEQSEKLSEFANPNCKGCMGRGHTGYHIAEGKRFVKLCTANNCAQQNLGRHMAMLRLEALERQAEEAKRKATEDGQGSPEVVCPDGETNASEAVGNDLPLDSSEGTKAEDTGPTESTG